MSTRLHIVVSEELLARVDGALGPGQARADWIRRAVERALGDVEGSVRVEAHAPRMGDGRDVDSRPAPAEQPETSGGPAMMYRGPEVEAEWRERTFRPYPKGGKR